MTALTKLTGWWVDGKFIAANQPTFRGQRLHGVFLQLTSMNSSGESCHAMYKATNRLRQLVKVNKLCISWTQERSFLYRLGLPHTPSDDTSSRTCFPRVFTCWEMPNSKEVGGGSKTAPLCLIKASCLVTITTTTNTVPWCDERRPRETKVKPETRGQVMAAAVSNYRRISRRYCLLDINQLKPLSIKWLQHVSRPINLGIRQDYLEEKKPPRALT